VHILGLCGSLRDGSLNFRLLEAAGRSLTDDVSLELSAHVAALPLFDEDLEVEPLPHAVQRFHAAIRNADAILVASPEYNGSLTGPLKNALDWASRPAGDAVLRAKPLAVVGASPSRFGAAWAQAETRRIADRIGADVIPLELPVAKAADAFTVSGDLRDPDLACRLQRLMTALVDLARGLTELEHLAVQHDAVQVGATPPGVAA
jgi:chromate reductase, NAD(P)H dehydrogenase (quinone)